MNTIEIDFEVFKALTARRPSEAVTENEVLRELLGLSRQKSAVQLTPATDDWLAKGVRFPSGTEFRAHYKGKTYLARAADGVLQFDGKRFENPSAAAMTITGNPVNGWTFWECRFPGQTKWQVLKSLRK